jgi:hypothetical protein
MYKFDSEDGRVACLPAMRAHCVAPLAVLGASLLSTVHREVKTTRADGLGRPSGRPMREPCGASGGIETAAHRLGPSQKATARAEAALLPAVFVRRRSDLLGCAAANGSVLEKPRK